MDARACLGYGIVIYDGGAPWESDGEGGDYGVWWDQTHGDDKPMPFEVFPTSAGKQFVYAKGGVTENWDYKPDPVDLEKLLATTAERAAFDEFAKKYFPGRTAAWLLVPAFW